MGLFRKKKEERAETLNMTDISDFNSIFSGQEITRSQAMEIPTVSACINKIAETVSRLPVRLYRRTNDGISEITDDCRLSLLNCDTGDTLNPVDMWRSAIEDYFLGNGAWVYINGYGKTIESIHYVDSRNIGVMANTDPIFKSFDIIVNGRKYYDFQFFRLFRKTRTGYSNVPLQEENQKILSVAYNSLKLEDKMNKHGGNKSGFFKLASKASKEAFENIKACCKSLFDNSESTKTFVLNDGLEFQPTSSTSVELQINENKKVNSVEICKIFGFPHTVIDGNATEDDNKKFISAVTAILNHIETALDLSFLLEKEKNQGFYFAFDTKELTRGSVKERYEAYEIAVRNHILQIDEIRKEEDFAPTGFNFITMGLGDVLLNPQTMEVFTPNTGQITSLKANSHGEERAEIELRFNHNHDERGRFASGGGGGSPVSLGNSAKSVDKSDESDIIKETTNAVGTKIKIVDKVKIIGEPNSITQIVSKNGGISRNYYGEDGKQTKQISNNDHNHKKESTLGKHGEHAHDYFYDENGKLKHGEARELTEQERKENSDIL